jgi:GNAT superfamily N-acetyltransferase
MVLVRQAYPSDAQAIARIHVDTWRSTYAGLLPDRVLAGMKQENHRANWLSTLMGQRGSETVLVAEQAKIGVVGFVSAGRARTGLAGYDAEVYTLYVVPDSQNQGIGTKLLNGAFQRLAEEELHGVMLWVLARNPSRFFYEAVGGAKIAQRKERLWGVVLPELAYGWPDLTRAVNRSRDGARAD